MRSINTVILIGNVTRDPEVKKMAKGDTIATFGLATNREWYTASGQEQRSTEFHEIVCFGGLANVSELRVKKGMLVHITGHLKTRSWDDADGLKRFRTEIVADELIILTKRAHTGIGEPSSHSTENSEMANSENAEMHNTVAPNGAVDEVFAG